jgi:hypothetical protein
VGDIERTIGYLSMEKFEEFIKNFDPMDTEVYEQLLKEVDKNPNNIHLYIMMNGQVDKTGFMSFMAGLEMGFKFNQYLNKEVTK